MDLNTYQQECRSTAIYDAKQPESEQCLDNLVRDELVNECLKWKTKAQELRRTLNYAYTALGLSGEAGETAEKIKKMIRDDGGVLTQPKREQLLKELGDCLWYISNLAFEAGLSLEEIARANLEKLSSRKERGMLQGSGDNR